jgi:hypothetical protein
MRSQRLVPVHCSRIHLPNFHSTMSFLFSKESEDKNIYSPVPSLSDTHIGTDEMAIERLLSYAHSTQIIDVSCIHTTAAFPPGRVESNEAGSCGVSCGILRSHYPPSPRLRRVLLAFIPVAAYSAEAVASAAKAGSYGVFGGGESNDTTLLPQAKKIQYSRHIPGD